ncbi:uncharacterized protein [Rutidosis leptorrhynchoides]|uniref:uncharacterized protein n=1 Tax=Rutidosis leptorrhynchoides TaxID=125765 RepID=UPI003A9A06A8
MGSSKAKKPPPSKTSLKPKNLKKKKKKTKSEKPKSVTNNVIESEAQEAIPVQEQGPLSFFLQHFQSSNQIRLSSLELESIEEKGVVELCDEELSLDKYLKKAFRDKWKHELCESQLVEDDVGSPRVLIVSASALRSLELFKAVRPLTKQCPAVKLFSKHMKVEEQVSLLKNRANIASGTPSRIKKLIDIGALNLSRLQVLVLDLHTDVKGYFLFTLPQVRDEFWDLYKTCFHQRLMQGDLRICLHGPIPSSNAFKGKKKKP